VGNMIGKKIGGYHYIHKSALDTLPPRVQERVEEARKLIPSDFVYDIVQIGKDDIHFTSSPNWDIAYEPDVGDRYVVNTDGSVRYAKGRGQIFHRRHLFVKPDYRGFDMEQDKKRVEWWSSFGPDIRRIGYKKFWLDWLATLPPFQESVLDEFLYTGLRLTEFIDRKLSGLHESLSKIVFHATKVHSLIDILKEDRFMLTISLGTEADSILQPMWKPYYFSVSRIKYGGYSRSMTEQAILVLDGNKFNQRYQGGPVDYWGKDFSKNGTPEQQLRNDENEERIFYDKPFIEKANSYIMEIHIGYKEINDYIRNIVALAEKKRIPVYGYDIQFQQKDFEVLNKNKAKDLSKYSGEVEVQRYEYGKLYHKFTALNYLYAGTWPKELDKKVNDSLYTLRTVWSIDDWLNGLYADIHNVKNNKDYADELQELFRNMKKERTSDFKEFVNLILQRYADKEEQEKRKQAEDIKNHELYKVVPKDLQQKLGNKKYYEFMEQFIAMLDSVEKGYLGNGAGGFYPNRHWPNEYGIDYKKWMYPDGYEKQLTDEEIEMYQDVFEVSMENKDYVNAFRYKLRLAMQGIEIGD
jgi:hypothetical protein